MPSNTDEADRAGPCAFADRLFEPVDAASLAFFRVAFGLVLGIEVIRYLAYGWVRALWIEPSFRFTYPGFGWVAPWPGDGMLVHYAALGLLAVLIAVGLFYRAAAALFCIGYTYVFLLDQTAFVNHFYLICVLAGLMACVPAHATGSIESHFRPGVASRTVPAWTLWLLRFQIGAVYFFGGLAKLNVDWLRGEPVRSAFLARRVDEPVIGWFAQQEWFVGFVAYGGLCFDLLIVPLLLWRRTRAWAFGAAVGFHAINIGGIGFSIGLFPLLMVLATTLFLDPAWPRRLGAWWRGGAASADAAAHGVRHDVSHRRRAVIVALLGCWVAIQIVLPLRHLIYPGRVAWTEEGSRFAWHMMLRHKRAETWAVVGDPVARRSWVVDPRTMMSHEQVLAMSGDAQRTSVFLQRVRERLDRR